MITVSEIRLGLDVGIIKRAYGLIYAWTCLNRFSLYGYHYCYMIGPFKGGTYRSLVHHTRLHYIILKYEGKTLWKQPFLCAIKQKRPSSLFYTVQPQPVQSFQAISVKKGNRYISADNLEGLNKEHMSASTLTNHIIRLRLTLSSAGMLRS